MFDDRATAQGWTGGLGTAAGTSRGGVRAQPERAPGHGKDIAAAVAYLASPLADYVNEIDLRVDGGITPVP